MPASGTFHRCAADNCWPKCGDPSRWLRFVLSCNHRLLASGSQVEEFLFPDGRQGLGVWRPVLQEVQRADCFYCLRPMSAEAVVDHFLPWVRYRRDLGHNFVLAHAQCNQQKNDHLASCAHLERWCQRNEDHGLQMAREFDREGLPHDWATLRRLELDVRWGVNHWCLLVTVAGTVVLMRQYARTRQA